MTALILQMKPSVRRHRRYVIEIGGAAAGLVMQEQYGFRFFAARHVLNPLNRVIFSSPRHAEEACRKLLRRSTFQTPRKHGGFARHDGSANSMVGG